MALSILFVVNVIPETNGMVVLTLSILLFVILYYVFLQTLATLLYCRLYLKNADKLPSGKNA